MAINQDIQSRVDAYMGNPEALAQKYQQNQQLIDLLALQKIKSEKEAAARQMQMQMAQKQAASGEAPMTVAQQREKEVMDLTKDELVGQQGKLLQQQQGEQQAAMQKLLSGIAAAPGAQSAAAPQAMAAGGIVAFEGGGSVDSGLTQAEQDYKKALDAFRRFGGAQRQRDPEGFANAQQSLEEARQRRDTLMSSWQEEQGGANRAVPGRATGAALAQPPVGIAAIPTPAAPAAAPAGEYRDEGLGGRRAALPAPTGGNPPPPPAVRRPAGPAAPTMPAAPAAPAGLSPEQSEMQTASSQGIQGILGALRTNPAAEQGAEYMRASNILGMSPEEKALIAENRAKTAEMTAARFNPDTMRERKLQNFLLGMGGQSSGFGALGAGATSSVNYERSMEDAERGEKLGLMKLREGDFEKARGIREKAYEGGLKALELSSRSRDQGVASGASRVDTLQRSADEVKRLAQEGKYKELELRLKEQENAARAAQVRATQEGTEQSRLLAITAGLERDITRTTATIMNKYQPQIDMARQTVKPGDKQGEQRVQDMMTQRDLDIKNATENLVRQRQQVEGVLYKGAGPTGPSSGMRVVGEREK